MAGLLFQLTDFPLNRLLTFPHSAAKTKYRSIFYSRKRTKLELTNLTSEKIKDLLSTGSHFWLLGAGVSISSNVPAMNTLTKRVFDCLQEPIRGFVESVRSELVEGSNVGLRP